jgi:DNA polymerase-3 subunit delta
MAETVRVFLSGKGPIAGKTAPGYLIYGEEMYWHRKAIDALSAAFGGEKETVAGDEITWEAMRELLMQPSFFGPRLWVVRDAKPLFAAKSAIPSIDSISPGNCLVLSCTVKGNPAPKSFMKAWQDLGCRVLESPIPTFGDAAAFVSETLGMRKLRIGRDALDRLILLTGRSLDRLESEIEKICLYMGEQDPATPRATRAVTVEVVAACVSEDPEKTPFNFIDAVSSKNAAESLQEMRDLRTRGANPIMLLSMMANHFGLMWRAKESSQRGIPQASLGKALGVHPYSAKKALQQSKHWSYAQMETAMYLMLQSDESIKRGRIDPDLSVENLLVALSKLG